MVNGGLVVEELSYSFPRFLSKWEVVRLHTWPATLQIDCLCATEHLPDRKCPAAFKQ